MLHNMIQCNPISLTRPNIIQCYIISYPMLYNTWNSFKSSRPSLDITPVLPTKFDLILNITSIIPSCSIVTNLHVSMRLRVALSSIVSQVSFYNTTRAFCELYRNIQSFLKRLSCDLKLKNVFLVGI